MASEQSEQDDIRERDLSSKANEDLTAEEKRELARRFKEFQQLVRENGARNLGLRTKRGGAGGGGKKAVQKWDPTALATKGRKLGGPNKG